MNCLRRECAAGQCCIDALMVGFDHCRVDVGERDTGLTPTEFRIVVLLAANAGDALANVPLSAPYGVRPARCGSYDPEQYAP